MKARTRPSSISLEGDGFVRFADVFPSIIPVGLTQAYLNVARGNWPKPVKVGRSTLLRKEDVRQLLRRIESGEFDTCKGRA